MTIPDKAVPDPERTYLIHVSRHVGNNLGVKVAMEEESEGQDSQPQELYSGNSKGRDLSRMQRRIRKNLKGKQATDNARPKP